MAIGCQSTFSRLVWWVTPLDSQHFSVLWFPFQYLNTASTVLGLLPFFVQLLVLSILWSSYSTNNFIKRRQLAHDALEVGVVMQLGVLVTFAIVVVRFLIVSRKWIGQPVPFAPSSDTNWVRLLRINSVATFLINVSRYSIPSPSLGYRLMLLSSRRAPRS